MFTSEHIDRFLLSLRSNGAPENTVRAYRADLEGFLSWIQDMPPMLTAQHLQGHVQNYVTQNRREWAPTTTKRKIASIRSFGRFIGTPLLEGYRTPKPAKAMPHPIPEGINGVLEMIMECKTPEQKCLVALCGLQGLRVTEARTIAARNIRVVDMEMTIPGKGGKFRTIPLSATAWAFIRPVYDVRMADEKWLDPFVAMPDRTARALITRLGAKAALSRPIASHDLRATFATAAYEKTHDLRAVQELLGHADSATTEIYTGISGRAMRAAVEVA